MKTVIEEKIKDLKKKKDQKFDLLQHHPCNNYVKSQMKKYDLKIQEYQRLLRSENGHT